MVVDEGIDLSNLNKLLWALYTRESPEISIKIIRRDLHLWPGPEAFSREEEKGRING